MRKYFTTLVTLAALSAILVGCKTEPVPDRVAVTGDSVTLQAILYHDNGIMTDWDSSGKVNNGWRADHSIGRVQEDVATEGTSPEVLVVAFGHNYWQDFSPERQKTFRDLLQAPHEDACVVAVMPWYTGSNPTHLSRIEQVRLVAYHQGLLSNDNPDVPDIVLVDWKPIVDANPEYHWHDGVHLPMDEEWHNATPEMVTAGNAYAQMMQDGVDECYANVL